MGVSLNPFLKEVITLRTTHVSSIPLPLVGCALAVLLATGALGVAQDTRPAGPGQTSKKQAANELRLQVYSCPTHPQVRMPQKGVCPLCETGLQRRAVRLGGEAIYPLDTCPVSGMRLGEMGSPVVMAYDGREVRFCSAGCIKRFESDQASYWEKIDVQIIQRQLPYYPFEICVVSDESLTEWGKPVDRAHRHRLVRFCCNMCPREFAKEPARFLAKLDEAVNAGQRKAYPLDTCPVSGQKLGSMGNPVEIVVANRLVRFCCRGCLRGFWKDPAKHLATLEEAWPARHDQDAHKGKEHDQGRESKKHHDHDHDHDH